MMNCWDCNVKICGSEWFGLVLETFLLIEIQTKIPLVRTYVHGWAKTKETFSGKAWSLQPLTILRTFPASKADSRPIKADSENQMLSGKS